MTVSSIWVVIEPSNGSMTTTSLELLSHARSLTSSVSGITWGTHDATLTQMAGEFGAINLYDVGPLHRALPGVPVASAIAELLSTVGAPDAILLPSSYDGRDIADRLSARLDLPVLTNVTGIEDQGGLLTEHPIFGGTQTVKARFTRLGPGIFVVRSKSFTVTSHQGAVASITKAPTGDTGRCGTASIAASFTDDRSGPKLEEATDVVSGGRGLGNASSYSLIQELATLLKGAPGASRAIVDAGWVPYSRQVGQTGKTVKPIVYIACGISGATQHMVGMKGSRYIVAINKDANAPIFQIADLGIVGDVHEILPSLIETLKSRR